jgi:putative membrane protein
MKFLIALLINGLVVYAASSILSGVSVGGYLDAIIVGLLLAIVNTFIRPILTFLTLPITILTLGLFLLFVNGAMVLLVDWFLSGFRVDGWFWAIVFSLILALLNLLTGGLKLDKK